MKNGPKAHFSSPAVTETQVFTGHPTTKKASRGGFFYRYW